MSRFGVDIMWSESLTVFAHGDRQQWEVFQLTQSGWEPPVDVLETETGLVIIVALPGVRPDEMQTVIGRGELIVSGLRRWPTLSQPARIHRIELPHGRFQRHLKLPGDAYQLVDQAHADGCLILTLKRLV
jgi:HSP20 family molecular chaperone IbpA